ncbi:MAG: sulfurtransferase [Hydrogenophilales bacterium 16-64-46]|nr:MAG: sulfurtransferase [Hydrogenophilales bacterium 12-64-13]OYZ05114.1 MAG: sulfurtransferase [Hydrogenophilales bacterium 16-64-46]OZA37932.1 MAG: sulfurtransferase [Hydrogenophilales bacterium 17-64-34]HQT00537.1 sulfurtransferase [Thiobacillus sp.]
MTVVNLSCYKFITLEDRAALKADLSARLGELGLLGTILLAPEGINVFLAGSREAIDAGMAYLRADPRFADLAPKESLSAEAPFRKLRIRLKKEIITMKQPLIRPEDGRAPSVPAALLRKWLDRGCDDEGRPVVMLDTRNDYEVAAGSFAHAIDYGVKVFSEFPAHIAAHRDDFIGKTVVSFCTGGIRCEKAAIHMKALGLERVYQLEGGILKYFEDVGGAHYQGDCFVFDEREAVAADLHPVSGRVHR